MGNLLNRCAAGLLAALFLIGSAVAETIPATIGGTTAATFEYTVNGANYFATPSGVCPPSGQTYANPPVGYGYGVCQSNMGTYFIDSNIIRRAVCPAGYSFNGSVCVAEGNSCPTGQGWTLSGSTCTRPDCEAGQDRNAQGQCVKDCTAKQGMSLPNTNYETDVSGNGSFGDCRIHCSTTNSMGFNVVGTAATPIPGVSANDIYHNSSGCKFTGASAQPGDYQSNGTGETPNKNDPKTPKDCIGAGMGYISSSTGKTTCVAAQDAPDGQKPSNTKNEAAKESGKAGADGKPDPTSPDYKKEEKSTSTSGGKTTETTTTTTSPTDDGNGNLSCPSGATLTNGKCVSVSSKTSDTSSYCNENPQAPACDGTNKNSKSTFGGTCDSGFVCDGDAATCAIAKASQQLNCDLSKKPGTADAGQAMIDGTDTAGLPSPANPDVTALDNLSYTDTGGSCLPDFQFTMMGRTSTVPTSGICTVAGWLGNIGVALSLLMAGYFVIGGLKV